MAFFTYDEQPEYALFVLSFRSSRGYVCVFFCFCCFLGLITMLGPAAAGRGCVHHGLVILLLQALF